jgi:hypothetical protein
MRTKCLPILLPASYYSRLEREARAAERDPVQQARFLLKRALEGDAQSAERESLTASHPEAQ